MSDLSKADSTTTITVMDHVDQQQQREIDATRAWTKTLAVALTLLLLACVGCFALLMRTLDCPHPDCAHHQQAR